MFTQIQESAYHILPSKPWVAKQSCCQSGGSGGGGGGGLGGSGSGGDECARSIGNGRACAPRSSGIGTARGQREGRARTSSPKALGSPVIESASNVAKDHAAAPPPSSCRSLPARPACLAGLAPQAAAAGGGIPAARALMVWKLPKLPNGLRSEAFYRKFENLF